MTLASKDFLRTKVGLTESRIKAIKKEDLKDEKDDEEESYDNQVNRENQNISDNKELKSEIKNLPQQPLNADGIRESFYDSLTKSKEKKRAQSLSNRKLSTKEKEKVSQEKEKIDKEIQEHEVKDMICNIREIKNYHTSFSETFSNDNKVLFT